MAVAAMTLKPLPYAGAIACLLCACGQPAPQSTAAGGPDDSVVYDCAGTRLTATWQDNGESVIVEIDGTTYTMDQAEAASGAKYADASGNSFWTKGGTDGMWMPAGSDSHVDCTAAQRAQ